MWKRFYKLISVVMTAAVLLLCFDIVAFADELHVGSVQGLPEKLVVLDDNGQSVSENGEYFFSVENMQAGETYTKKIQIMNLREDASYVINFRAEPLTNVGEIDLEKECSCDIYLDKKLVYYGSPSGEGTPDIRTTPVSLGTDKPGESHVMKVDIKWSGASVDKFIDEGAKIVDRNGVSVVREPSGQRHIEGEITFKWIFYAEVKDIEQSTIEISEISRPTDDDPSKPGQPSNSEGSKPPDMNDVIKTGETIAFIAIMAVALAMLLLIVLVIGKKKKKMKSSKKEK